MFKLLCESKSGKSLSFHFFFFTSVLVLLSQCNNDKFPKGEKTETIQTAQYLLYSLHQTDGLLPPSDINDHYFKQYGVPANLQKPLTVMYEKLREDLGHVRHIYVSSESVWYFLVNRYIDQPEDTTARYDKSTTLLNETNPVYIAFSLLAENLPDWKSIGNPSYIKTLARSFGTSEFAISAGIYILLRNDPSSIYEAVAQSISINITDTQGYGPEFVFSNVIVPFLMYISRDIPLQDSLEKSVFKLYANTFDTDSSSNELKEFIVAFKKYLAGNSLNVKYLNSLNAVFGRYNCRMYIDDKAAIGYHISQVRIPVNRLYIGSVLLLKKVNFCLSMSYLGLSVTNEHDVVLSIDDISDHVDDILFALEDKRPVISFSDKYPDVWNSLAVGFKADSANTMCATLLRQEFGDLTRNQIIQKLTHQIALHEVKHKWDEATGSDKGWYVVECEISAYFTETIYGPIPRYSLVCQLSRFQNLYARSSSDFFRNKMLPLLRELWKDVQLFSTLKLSDDEFRKEMITRYTSFSTSTSGNLPSLEKFNNEIVKPCFSHLPDFSLESERK